LFRTSAETLLEVARSPASWCRNRLLQRAAHLDSKLELHRMYTAWCRPVGCLLITRAGSNHATTSSSRPRARRCLAASSRSAQARLS
jgi:hypothetical protein